jgi:hypothetical protein
MMYFDQYYHTKGLLEKRLLDETDYEARHKIKNDMIAHNAQFLTDFKRYMSRRGFLLKKKSRMGFYVPKRVYYRQYGTRHHLYWKSRWGYERSIQIHQIHSITKEDTKADTKADTKGYLSGENQPYYQLIIQCNSTGEEGWMSNGLFTPIVDSAISVGVFPSHYCEVCFQFEFEEDRDILYDSIQLLIVGI